MMTWPWLIPCAWRVAAIPAAASQGARTISDPCAMPATEVHRRRVVCHDGNEFPSTWAADPDRPAERIVSVASGQRARLMASVPTWLAVGAGGALGSMARFWLTGVVAAVTGPRYPYGTLLINILGSFVIGGVAGLTL